MRTKTPTVWRDWLDGTATLAPRDPAQRQVPLDSPAWFAWLAAPTTTSFAYPVDNTAGGYIEGFMTVRKEHRDRGGRYWVAYWCIGGRLRKAYLGRSETVTTARLQAVAAAWFAQMRSPATQ